MKKLGEHFFQKSYFGSKYYSCLKNVYFACKNINSWKEVQKTQQI